MWTNNPHNIPQQKTARLSQSVPPIYDLHLQAAQAALADLQAEQMRLRVEQPEAEPLILPDADFLSDFFDQG